MKRLLVLAWLVGFALISHSALAQKGANASFEQMKALAGDWNGNTDSGKTVLASYKVVSGGSALLETLHPSEESEMVTLYHADGNRVAMTHYCDAGNQPQMQTAPLTAAGNPITFVYVRATNLASPTAGHMNGLVVTIQDKDHFTQKWTFREKGKDHTEVFHFTRKS